MTDTVTVGEAISMLAEIFEVSEEDLQLDSRREDISGWDSLGVLTLMAEFDSRFGITITSETLGTLEKVRDLIDILKKHGAIQE